MWWDWDYWPMHHFFFGPLFMIAIFAICMIMMMWMMRGHRHSGASGALDILSERYARGEINQAEYEERRRVLRSLGSASTFDPKRTGRYAKLKLSAPSAPRQR